MSIRVLHNRNDDDAILYDSVTEEAFGPVIHADYNSDIIKTASDVAYEFLEWLSKTHPNFKRAELVDLYSEFIS